MITSILSQYCVFALMTIAAIVAAGLMKRRNMWRWIIAYWVVLTVKNAVDLVGTLL